ncbi:hypothetical protein DIPPA_70203 [Diplonema papillatum]|nr:hypothetical protein DIPPA_70203 [Diplonema papillatum]
MLLRSTAALVLLAYSSTAAPLLWNYDPTSGDGPSSWAHLSVDCENTGAACVQYPFVRCAEQRQSPVDLRAQGAAAGRPAFLHFWRRASAPGEAAQYEKITNTGAGIDVRMLQGKLHLTSSLFSHQLVLRTIKHKLPAEHLLNGIRHDIEQQLVFIPADAEAEDPEKPWTLSPEQVRISLLFSVRNHSVATSRPADNPPSIIDQLLSHYPSVAALGDSLYLSRFVPWVDISQDEVFHYEGSETEPPCAEKVTWLVSRAVRPASESQRSVLLAGQSGVVPPPFGNARPVQPVAGRRVSVLRLSRPLRGTVFPELALASEPNVPVESGAAGEGAFVAARVPSPGEARNAVLREAVIGLGVVLVFMVVGFLTLNALRQRLIPAAIVPSWLGGAEDLPREQWWTTHKETFGTMSPCASASGDLEEEDEEEYEEAEEDDETEMTLKG